MIGKIISHYEITEKLGEGGMGVVYRAMDTKLERPVALKFLPPEMVRNQEAKARFLQEARAAAALSHPNICTIYEIGEDEGETFIAMALIEGESLSNQIRGGPLKLGEAIDITSQVAEGLAAAHEKGIVHRDMKPANVMVAPDGRAKIMDFGLAKSSGQTRLTKTGTSMGTIAYMSPEQSRGADTDHRTDIWSLGVTLYEMVTGQRPFRGDYDQAVVYAILNEEPEPITTLRAGVPMELERITAKAMEKRPGDRYQHAEDMLVDLRAIERNLGTPTITRSSGRSQASAAVRSKGRRWWGLAVAAVVIAAAAAGFIWNATRTRSLDAERAVLQGEAPDDRPSIAVLPFLDMSPERDHDYFCEGMAEELINAFTQLGGLKVSARTSSFQYKGAGHDIRQVGNDLGVETVLEGSVRKSGSRLRITAQLIDVADGIHLWSETFDRDMDDIFAIQDEISLAIVDALRPELLGDKSAGLVERATANPDAYNLYLRGRWFWNKRTPQDLTQGIEYLERAIEVAPDYALAYAGMADCYTALAEYSLSPPEGTALAAKRAALKALEIDDTLAEAHAALGYIKIVYDWDWHGAEADFKRAIELDPHYAPGHHRYAALLSIMGRPDEGLAEIRQAQVLEPHTASISTILALLLCDVGELDAAIEELERALEIDPSFGMTHLTLGVAYMYAARYDEALSAFQEQNRLLGGRSPHAHALTGIAQAFSGNADEAQRALADVKDMSGHQPVSSSLVALLCFVLDESDEGFEWLEKAYEERDLILRMTLPVFRRPDVVGDDPRLHDLMERMGLES